jgi:hypothetical protein
VAIILVAAKGRAKFIRVYSFYPFEHSGFDIVPPGIPWWISSFGFRISSFLKIFSKSSDFSSCLFNPIFSLESKGAQNRTKSAILRTFSPTFHQKARKNHQKVQIS